jgi:hypothetical protein
MSEGPYCCEAAADEPMAGSADSVDVWLLLEYRPTWRAKALEDNALSPDVRAWLQGCVAAYAAQGRKARPQFVRQPEYDRAGVTLFVADAKACRRFDAASYDALAMVDLARGGEAVTEPHYFVCTNAARDRCCGRFGLPVYAALRERVGPRVWQTTHVGGHRFAPNVLVLPGGRLYGRVQPAEVGDFVATVERGALGARWLRGTSFLAPPAQAAEVFAASVDDAPAPRGQVESLGDDRYAIAFEDGRTVTLALGAEIESLASCGDETPKRVRPFVRGEPL